MGGWFANIKIKWKFVIGFGLAIVLSVAIAVMGIYSSSTIDADYSYILENPQRRMDAMASVTLNLARLRRTVAAIGNYVGDDSTLKELKAEADNGVTQISNAINTYNSFTDNDSRLTKTEKEERLANSASLIQFLNTYKAETLEPIYNAALKNDVDATKALLDSGAKAVEGIINGSDSMYKTASDIVDSMSENATASSNSIIRSLIILAVVSALISLVMAILTTNSITGPIKKLLDITNEVSKGHLNVNSMPETKDEIGELVSNFFIVINVVKSIVDDLNDMGRKHDIGDIDAMVDESKYEGSYREVASGTNKMVKGHVDLILMFMEKMSLLVGGDFKVPMEKLPGKKVIMNESLEALRKTITTISSEINSMIKNVSDGKVSERIHVEKYSGDWVKLMEGLNSVLQSYDTPIQEMMSVLQKLARGNFKDQMVGVYKGDFNEIKNSVNNMVVNISAYINEISAVLNQLANNNLDQHISRDYVGEFASIKDAINNIIDKFNSVIGEITSATDQVAAGARQISESSMSLAQGATEQASSVEELTATVMSVNEKTQLNAENSRRAADLSTELKNHAVDGNKQMKDMLSSMKDINEASSNISKIINIIKDISFQTNLLALNASIEAAHAGVHGAGFSVVADEVRSLAVKSQEAASNTTELIETSIQRVNEGTNIAVKTDEALEKIVDGVTEVSTIIFGISTASNEQALAISQINDGVSQIAQVVQNNSATSEESASAAQELSSQSEMLKNMVKIFNLK